MAESTKKTTTKKAVKKAFVMPPNPTRAYGPCSRKMQVSKEVAADLVKRFEFRVLSVNGEMAMVMADSTANRKYEAANA